MDKMICPVVLGDIVYRQISSSGVGYRDVTVPAKGVVTYINKEHGWYNVAFENGIVESYRFNDGVDELEEYRTLYLKKYRKKPIGFYIFESGILCKTMKECAKIIGAPEPLIRQHLDGMNTNVRGFHIYHLQ